MFFGVSRELPGWSISDPYRFQDLYNPLDRRLSKISALIRAWRLFCDYYTGGSKEVSKFENQLIMEIFGLKN